MSLIHNSLKTIRSAVCCVRFIDMSHLGQQLHLSRSVKHVPISTTLQLLCDFSAMFP